EDRYFPGMHFLLAARYQLTIGSLAALRAHITDALRSGRIAIECAAFAARIKNHPDLAMAWLNAGRGETEYDRYRQRFSGQKMFPEDHKALEELGKRFDMTSKLTHPSVYALAEHVKIVSTSSGLEVSFHYFPVQSSVPGEPTRTFFWT